MSLRNRAPFTSTEASDAPLRRSKPRTASISATQSVSPTSAIPLGPFKVTPFLPPAMNSSESTDPSALRREDESVVVLGEWVTVDVAHVPDIETGIVPHRLRVLESFDDIGGAGGAAASAAGGAASAGFGARSPPQAAVRVARQERRYDDHAYESPQDSSGRHRFGPPGRREPWRCRISGPTRACARASRRHRPWLRA